MAKANGVLVFKTHNARGFLICFAVTILVLVLYAFNGLDALELKAVDFRFQLRNVLFGNRPIGKDIAIITIDENSIERLGRWPWPRRTHARLARWLEKAGAKVVAFDVLFTEPDRDNPASDQELVEAAKETGIIASAFLFRKKIHDNVGGDPLFPFNPLSKESYTGFINLDPDRDGVRRRAHLYAIEGEQVYPSLAVATLALSQGKTFKEILSQLPVVIDKDPLLAVNELFINYAYSKQQEIYPLYSFVDVLDGKVEASTFNGKIVFVGGTAAALFDILPIPYDSVYPGVLIHANLLDNLQGGNYLHEIPTYVTAFYVLGLGLLLGYYLPRLAIWAKLVAFLVLVGGGVFIGLWFFSSKNLVIHMVPPLFAGLGSYGGVIFYQLVIEEREKRKIKGSFRQYLSPKIIDIITKDPTKLKLGGEEREVSIFFLDIAGFTTMSEALKPTQLVEVMNQCLTEFSHIILKHDGLINKYIGDCIMAFWNAPADQPRHAAQACLAALDCIAALPDLNRKFKERGLPDIDCRVGINTGTVVVGNMGSHEKFDYTVMGDPVNLASRLEGANKQYHTHVMVSDVTFELVRNEIEARDLDLIRVKGKKEPRKVFEVLCKKGEMSEELSGGRDKYHEGLRLYRQRAFKEAIDAFEEVFRYLPDDYVTRVYLERARTFTVAPPPTLWDGVYEMLTK